MMIITGTPWQHQPRIKSHYIDVRGPSFNRTPQLVIGGRRPSPRKLNAVSPRIIPGMDNEADAIR
ncbi:MAG: hypothetical protein CM1200mP20_07840 [Pseudomonadota bacterium]|nr:MAG: hypothetical protein CM1200mP20_07840 [Pseudomonadota bacterium]